MTLRDDDPSGLPANRVEALSDGAFAIAMTLLVLELRVPEVADGNSAAKLTALGAMWPKFVGFVLGFVLLGTVWVPIYGALLLLSGACLLG